ncbi:hypothetical protein [Flammeovirga sp. SJP92]|uniref:hypothetical protein n=1 Tax=Flammeovirga sp. SJP92 TaxID=1775430 RepID=UPI0007888F38|nr:hypothetical protein [Flammeovirga sp. SJP92]KXX66674.1 hypothetical protein AVL50_31015 [Flammeovirga sp. SJP92]
MNTNSEKAKKRLYIIIGILVITSLVLEFIQHNHLEQTALLFIGIPALIALMVIKYSKTPKTAYGVAFQVITLFLLMASILFGEGTICIIISAPLFYGITFLIIFIIQLINKKKDNKAYTLVVVPIIIVLFQPSQMLIAPSVTTVTTSKILDHQVSISALQQQPNFLEDYPSVFNLGFPKPQNIKGEGLNVGDQRHIQFLSNTKGIGTLSLVIDEVAPHKIIFNILSDDTHINHWLTWKKVTVEIENREHQSIVTWTSSYTCDLGPKWYFGPIESYVVNVMNQHLIHSYFDGNSNN